MRTCSVFILAIIVAAVRSDYEAHSLITVRPKGTDHIPLKPISDAALPRLSELDRDFVGNSSQDRIVRVLGHYNTGTNFMAAIIAKNSLLGVAHRKGAGSIIQEGSKPGDVPGCRFWKHCRLTTLLEDTNLLADCGQPELVAVAMVRNPLAWLSAMKRRAYSLTDCSDGEDWYKRPCTYPDLEGPLPPKAPTKQSRVAMSGQRYDHLPQIWTRWAQDYANLSKFGFNRYDVVRYEDLVEDAPKVLSRLATVVGVDFDPMAFKQVEDGVSPGTIHSTSMHDNALRYIKNREYLNDFSHNELVEVCSLLDRDVMKHYRYDDCDNY